MAEKEDVIEIIADPEELPSDVKKRVLRINALTRDDKERVEHLMDKLDSLISKADDTQVLNSIIELKVKLTQIMIYMSKLEEKIDTIPLDRGTQRIEYIKDEIRDDISILSDEIQAAKRILLSKMEELKASVSDELAGIEDDRISVKNSIIDIEDRLRDSVEISLSDMKRTVSESVTDMKEDVKSSVNNSLSEAGYDIKTNVSDISDSIKDSVSVIGGDIKASMMGMKEDFRQSVSEISERFYEIEASINSKMAEIKEFLRAGSDNNDNTLTTLYVIRDVINKSNESIEISAENLGNMAANINNRLDKLSNFVDSVDSARIQLEENVKAINATRDNVNGFVTSLDKKTDDILNVVYGKVGELGTVRDELKKNVATLDKSAKNIAETGTKLEDSITLLDNLKSSHKKAEKDMKNAAKGITKTAKDIRQNDKDIKKTLGILKTIEKEAVKKEEINKEVAKELKRFNIHLAKLDEAEFIYRVMEIKKRIKKYKRLPRWASERRDMLLKSVFLFEVELVDISVVYALTKGDASFSGLKRLTGISDSLIRKSLKRLVSEGRIRKYKKARFVYYSIVV